jgi:tetratricopeptide (TPR) repeat protein
MNQLRCAIPIAGLAALLTAGCGSAPVREPDAERLLEVAEFHDVDPQELTSPIELDEEMRAWLRDWVRETDTSLEQLRQVLVGFQSPRGLDLKYEPGYTGTAREVFETHEYNCLSFSHLFVAMARELGIDAYYLNVAAVQNFRKEGDLVVVSGHVTAGYNTGPKRKILEFEVGPEVDYRSATPISDQQALAMYYSNRGAELLRDGDNDAARKWLSIAVGLAPDYADAWVNLGVARRRTGDEGGAEEAYYRAIEIDPESFSSYSNLASLMRYQGDAGAALAILELLDRRDNRDPYIYLALGDEALRGQRLDDARRYYRRAQNLSPQPETHAALGLLALESGDREEAERWLRKARQQSTEEERVYELERRLAAGES